MPPEFRRTPPFAAPQVGEIAGLVFGTFSDAVEDVKAIRAARGRRHPPGAHRPAKIIGRSTQVLPNNWKLYFENIQGHLHASILHAFLTSSDQPAVAARQHTTSTRAAATIFSQAKLDYGRRGRRVQAAALRSDTDLKLADNPVVESVDEYGDSVSVQI